MQGHKEKEKMLITISNNVFPGPMFPFGSWPLPHCTTF